jgi:hypothetical protein
LLLASTTLTAACPALGGEDDEGPTDLGRRFQHLCIQVK